MKVVFQAILGSIVVHITYLVGMMKVGYIKTKNYQPDISNSWDKVEVLQNEVVFGHHHSPFLYVLTFIAVTVVFVIAINLFRKLKTGTIL
ncbi:hypothetical protein ACFYKX_04835 [Cytobacillus sp. FJAT-54145]|uniref:Menaquinol-cytochrome c reductase cytochrome b subunit n=1 Tax=Cytobacillus spartinae TaxID=3299023 RepID=A0ABW6K6Y8_9BACI